MSVLTASPTPLQVATVEYYAFKIDTSSNTTAITAVTTTMYDRSNQQVVSGAIAATTYSLGIITVTINGAVLKAGNKYQLVVTYNCTINSVASTLAGEVLIECPF